MPVAALVPVAVQDAGDAQPMRARSPLSWRLDQVAEPPGRSQCSSGDKRRQHLAGSTPMLLPQKGPRLITYAPPRVDSSKGPKPGE